MTDTDAQKPPRSPKRDNQQMLEQFYDSLNATLLASPPDTLTDRLKPYHAEAVALVKDRNNLEWNRAYQAEKLIAFLRDPVTLDMEIARQITFLRSMDAPKAAFFEAQVKALPPAPDPDAFQSLSDDPYTRIRQAMLERLLDDLHWKYTRRYLNRLKLNAYTRSATTISMGIGVFFLFALIWSSINIGEPMSLYAGLELAIAAGFVGSSFSVLTSAAPDVTNLSQEEMRRQTNQWVLILRLTIGGIAATILYFFFESGLLGGTLLPNLDALAFSKFATPEENGSLGLGVPNADLCKLMVWSFAAGFSEKLVKSILGQVQDRNAATEAK